MNQHDHQAEIIQKTTGMIRTFLDELANGTSNYKSLHNLTEQVEHQYHDRFLIELIQNAHDAMNELDEPGNQGRLDILVAQNEEPHGALYIANDGQPFTKSNFESLSQLGQSDKDPEKSIGNKGIGFRSVLEITTSPEIYSRIRGDSKELDGYCFKFSPDVTKMFEAPIRQLLKGNDSSCSPLNKMIPLVDWGDGRLKTFRNLHSSKNDQWLKKELRYLSPYLLPIPIHSSDKTNAIKTYENQGYASIIRLPFKSESARTRAVKITEELDENTILFLDRVKSLSLNSGGKQRLIDRKVHKIDDPNEGQLITLEVIEDGAESYAKKQYFLWSAMFGGDNNPKERDEITKAILEDELPGRWPELTKATVSLAVRADGRLDQGRINIYLPTQLPTGCASHFNGPFYGDMSRTDIDFGKNYNELLLKRIGHMAIEIILESLAGGDVDQARAILDILAPSVEDAQAGSEWFKILQDVCEEKELKLDEQPIILTDEDWTSIRYTSLIPEIESPNVLTPDILREQATFGVIHRDLMNRKVEINSLFEAFQIESIPRDQDLAATVENVAEELHKAGANANWNGFWYDLIKLFKDKAEELKGKKILLGNDSTLHASGPDCTIFFSPRQGVDDDEIQTDGTTSDIPQTLRDHIAFLNDGIEIFNPQNARLKTPIRKFLESALIEPYRVMEIIRSVLVPRIPSLPISLNHPQSHSCRDILLWGLKLVAGMPDRGRGKTGTLQMLRQIPVPCHGGWYPIDQSSFGPSWSNTAGTFVFEYLKGTKTKECEEALGKILLPPTDNLWEGKGELYKDLLLLTGVFDGLRLISLEPSDWKAGTTASKSSYQLPDAPPPCIPVDLWKRYTSVYSPLIRERLYYTSSFSYEVKTLSLIPGLERYDDLDERTRIAFMNSLFASMHKWGASWLTTDIQKVDGVSRSVSVESPLSYCLKLLPWIAVDIDDRKEWEVPGGRWYIPKIHLAGGSWRYGHLRPLPGVLADKIDQNPALFDKGLALLGMPKFIPDADERSDDPRLLNALASALDSEIPDPNMFLNHIRVAWNNYATDVNNSFPDRIIISNGPKHLEAVKPDIKSPVYLPDSNISFASELHLFSLPVIEINTSDAKRLALSFKKQYGSAIRLASEMKVWPIVEGQSWNSEPGELLSDSELSWLPSVILTVYAFAGTTPPGLYAKKISSIAQVLRDAKIVCVSSLKAGLWMGDEPIADPPVAAMWLSQDKLLVCDEKYKDRISNYAEAFKTMIERDDLELPLMHVLDKIENIYIPTHEDICVALESLKIKKGQYDQAYDLWQGDFGKLIRMAMPVVALLKPSADIGVIVDIKNEEDLQLYLQGMEICKPTPQEIIGFIQSSDDYYILGEKLYETLGESAQLDKWNKALARVGERQLSNKNAEDEYRNHLRSTQALLETTLAHIIRRSSKGSSFKGILEQLEDIPFPEAWSSHFWEINFEHALQSIVPFFESLHALPDEISALRNSLSYEELKTNLLSAGVETNISPHTTYRNNYENLRSALVKFLKVAVAACIKEKVSPLSWEKSPEDLLSHFEIFFNHRAYLSLCSDCEFFELLKTIPREASQTHFWNAVDQSEDLLSLMTFLSLSAGDIAGADKELEKYKEMKRRQNRLTSVGEKEFDYTDENLSQLWGHIIGQIEEDSLPKVDLMKVSILEALRKRQQKQRGPIEKKKGARPRGRMSKEMEHLVGFAGEIHAYRMLTNTYGEEVVHPGTWKSSYSKRVFPGNNPDDNIGCDFMINQKKLTYHIEVKSSADNNDSFELGSSEIRAAMDMTRRKRHVFMIMHVYNALSRNPGFRLLPNPYDPKCQGVYSIEDAGARIRYRLKS
jgi:hypothetical protein